jgi:hypothetical protein
MSGQLNVCVLSHVERENDVDCACHSMIGLNTTNVLQTSLCDEIVACILDDTEEHEQSVVDCVKQLRI